MKSTQELISGAIESLNNDYEYRAGCRAQQLIREISNITIAKADAIVEYDTKLTELRDELKKISYNVLTPTDLGL